MLLRRGSQGREVEGWQLAGLIANSYSLKPSGADGDFGPLTHDQTKAFQKARGLVVDGVVGTMTWGAASTPKELRLIKEQTERESEHPGDVIICRGKHYSVPGVDLQNWTNAGVYHFTNSVRIMPKVVTGFVCHESTSRSRDDTTRGWSRPRTGRSGPYYIGIHTSHEADGSTHLHNDPSKDRLIHGGPHNNKIGGEVIVPYYPAWRSTVEAKQKWPVIIDAPWADIGQGINKPPEYVVPQPAQLESFALMLARFTDPDNPIEGIEIPRRWIGLSDDKKKMSFTRVKGASGPGIYAHGYYAHADGWFPILYAYLRIEQQLDPTEAYEKSVHLATGARWDVKLAA